MKALVLSAPNRLVYGDVPDAVPGPGETLIRIRACGICGSDIHGMDGSTGRRIAPLIMGHEAAGEIASPGIAGWPVGTRVTFDSTLYCGECPNCRQGAVNLCMDRRVIGVACAEYRRDGAFAEYACVPVRTLHRLPDELGFEQAALAEPVAVALHAVNRSPLACPGANIAVIGSGLIGLLLIQVLRTRGIDRITAVDVDAGRLELARRLGATGTCDAREPGCNDLLANLAADATFEVVGLTTTLQSAIAATRRGGDVVLVGNLASTAELPLQAVVTRELRLVGSCASAGEYPAAIELLAHGRINAAAMISVTASLAEGPECFRRLQSREPGLLKIVLQP